MTRPQTPAAVGGRFLVVDTPPGRIFTRDDITEEQRMFAETAAQFMRQEVLPFESRLFAHDWAFARALLKKAASLDLLGVEVPEAYGGMALSKVTGALVLEQIAAHPSFGACMGVHAAIGTLPLVYFGSDALKAKYLPRLVSGDLVGAYALTEAGSGSDARAAKTTAVLDADGTHYVLNGQKIWISNGGFADVFTVFAQVSRAAGAGAAGSDAKGDQFTAFFVERGPGVVSGPEEKKLGLDGSSTTTLLLQDVRVPIGHMLGRIGEGHKVAFNILNLGRVRLGARNMAAAREALRHAARYAVDRRQFGRPIAEFGLIQEKLADMAIRCFVGDAMVFRTLGDVDHALEAVDPANLGGVLEVIGGFAAECSINKVFTSEALAFVADEAIQVFGGNGYSREFPVERIYRDARITRIYEGTNEINRMLAATRLLKSGIGSRQPGASAVGEGLDVEQRALGATKDLALALFDAAQRVHGDGLKNQQEVLARLANVAIEVYAMESAIARALKGSAAASSRALPRSSMVEVFVVDAVSRALSAAAAVIRSLGRDAAPALDAMHALQRAELADAIPRRREIARAVVSAGGMFDL
jgi:alkylation response protein AidB-like acyl-CoA dehydrogenase